MSDFIRGDRRVIGFVQADQDIIAGRGFEFRNCAAQHRRTDFRTAAATSHGDGGDFFQGISVRQARVEGGRGVFLHFREIGVLVHPAAVDPIFPLPDPRTFHCPVGFCCDGEFVASANQGKDRALRREWF